MRNVLLIALALIGWSGQTAHATLIAYESFESYAPGGLAGNSGGFGWTGNWSAISGVSVANATLSYTNGPVIVNGGSRLGQIDGATNDTSAASRAIASQTGTLYMSVLVSAASGLESSDFWHFMFNNDTVNTNSGGFGKIQTNNARFGARVGTTNGGTTSDSATDIVSGTTYLLVGKIYKAASSTYNRVDLLINPASQTEGTAAVTASGDASTSAIAFFTMRTFNFDVGDKYQFDELRIGTTFADVVPVNTSTTYTLTAAAGTLNVLKGGKTAITSTVTNTGTGAADNLNYTGLTATVDANGTLSGSATSGGPVANNGGVGINSSLTYTATAYGSSLITPVLSTATNANLGSPATAGGTSTTTINVGMASAALNNTNRYAFGAPLSAALALNDSFATLSSKTAFQAGANAAGDIIGTEAILRAGRAATGTTTVTMQWRGRTPGEVFAGESGGLQQYPPLNASTGMPGLISDVLDLTIRDGANAPTNDPFVLQMSYDENRLAPALSNIFEASQAADGRIYVAWLNPHSAGTADDEWENAVNGNLTGTPGGPYLNDFDGAGGFAAGSWDNFAQQFGVTDLNLSSFVGNWGVDITNNVAWAVLDHNSQFAVVPEPASLVLAALGAAALLRCARRRAARLA